jgi:hypothetical protein
LFASRERGHLSPGFAPPSVVYPYIAADGPPQWLQRLQKRRDAGLSFGIVGSCGQEHADAPHPLALLRAHRKRPRRGRAAKQSDEIAAFH